jgi:hypothetical protein
MSPNDENTCDKIKIKYSKNSLKKKKLKLKFEKKKKKKTQKPGCGHPLGQMGVRILTP